MAQSSLWRQRLIHVAIHKTATFYIQSRLDVLAPGSAPVLDRVEGRGISIVKSRPAAAPWVITLSGLVADTGGRALVLAAASPNTMAAS